MLYFSELRGTPVKTTENIYLGKLEDMIFSISEVPQVTKLIVRSDKGSYTIGIKHIKTLHNTIIVDAQNGKLNLEENELYIGRNLLDKQIIDIVGNKMVRVNDVVLLDKPGLHEYEIYVMGVDIGTLGIFRRIYIEEIVQKFLSIFSIKVTSQFLSWADIQPLELSSGEVKLKRTEAKLRKMRPEDLADYLERTSEMTVHHVLKVLGMRQATDVVENLDVTYQKDLFTHWKSEEAAEIIEHMDPDEAVDILSMLSKEKKEDVERFLSEPARKKIQHLMRLSQTAIGGLITTDYLAVNSHKTAYEIMAMIRKDAVNFSSLPTVHVLNENEQLVGIFNLHELIMQKNDTPAYKFMNQNLVEALLTTPVQIAIHKMLKYHVDSIPVIDNDRHIIGLLTIDDVSEYIEKKLFK